MIIIMMVVTLLPIETRFDGRLQIQSAEFQVAIESSVAALRWKPVQSNHAWESRSLCKFAGFGIKCAQLLRLKEPERMQFRSPYWKYTIHFAFRNPTMPQGNSCSFNLHCCRVQIGSISRLTEPEEMQFSSPNTIRFANGKSTICLGNSYNLTMFYVSGEGRGIEYTAITCYVASACILFQCRLHKHLLH